MRPPGMLMSVCVFVFSWCSATAQDLGELARQERQRRASAGPVRYRIDNLAEAGTGNPAVSANSRPAGPASPSSSPPPTMYDKRANDLLRRGPAVWLELGKANRRLADLEKELKELERTATPTWRRSLRVEDPGLVKKRREVENCRRRLQELDQEWKWLQDRARRLNLPPGVLRGTR